jgi:hypothetical protein
MNIDSLVKSRTDTILVIPANAGIQPFQKDIDSNFYPGLRSGVAGVTGLRSINEVMNLKIVINEGKDNLWESIPLLENPWKGLTGG